MSSSVITLLSFFSCLFRVSLSNVSNVTSSDSPGSSSILTAHICRDETCNFDCTNKDIFDCRNSIFICTTSVKSCNLNCNNIAACKDNTALYSFAQNTKVDCLSKDSCMTSHMHCGVDSLLKTLLSTHPQWNLSTSEFASYYQNKAESCSLNCGGYGCKDSVFRCHGKISKCTLFANQGGSNNFENGHMECNQRGFHDSTCTLYCGKDTNACSQTTRLDCLGDESCRCVGAYQNQNKLQCFTILSPSTTTKRPSEAPTLKKTTRVLKKTTTPIDTTKILFKNTTVGANTQTHAPKNATIGTESSIPQTTKINNKIGTTFKNSTKITKKKTTKKVVEPKDGKSGNLVMNGDGSRMLEHSKTNDIVMMMSIILSVLCCFGVCLCCILYRRTRKLEKELVTTSNSTYANSNPPDLENAYGFNQEKAVVSSAKEGDRPTGNYDAITNLNHIMRDDRRSSQALPEIGHQTGNRKDMSNLTEERNMYGDDGFEEDDTSGSATSGSDEDLDVGAHKRNNSRYDSVGSRRKRNHLDVGSKRSRVDVSATSPTETETESTSLTSVNERNKKIELNFVNGDKRVIVQTPNVEESKENSSPRNYQQMMMDQIKTNIAILKHVNEINKTCHKVPANGQPTILTQVSNHLLNSQQSESEAEKKESIRKNDDNITQMNDDDDDDTRESSRSRTPSEITDDE